MLEIFAQIMLIVSAIVALSCVIAVQKTSKEMAMFMKAIKAIVFLNIIVGILDIIGVVVWLFL